MKRRLSPLLLLVACLLAGRVSSQERRDTATFCVMSYNVENLFDCRHDTLKDDYEFLPDAVRHWHYARYRRKLDNVARVITAVGGWTPPALVGLCEVENDSVLVDLTRHTALRESGYRYLIAPSADVRGIDVALLYQPFLFRPLYQQNLRVEKPWPNSRPTRDILYVGGLLPNGDTLDVFVAHFPSRSGGARQTAPYRHNAARRIKSATDSLMRVRRRPQIILMGDFNDPPDNSTVRDVLQALPPPDASNLLEAGSLYHLLARRAAAGRRTGSYKYRGAWQWLDHLIVSGTLLQPDALLRTSEAEAGVFAPDFLLTDDPRYGGRQPFRTYYGMKYQGGYSDHLPVYADFQLIVSY